MFKKLKFFEKEFKENGSIIIEDLEYISNVLNSYLGMLVHCKEYKLRKSIITSKEMEAFGKYMYTYPNYNKLSIYQDYLPITNHKKKYVKDLKKS